MYPSWPHSGQAATYLQFCPSGPVKTLTVYTSYRFLDVLVRVFYFFLGGGQYLVALGPYGMRDWAWPTVGPAPPLPRGECLTKPLLPSFLPLTNPGLWGSVLAAFLCPRATHTQIVCYKHSMTLPLVASLVFRLHIFSVGLVPGYVRGFHSLVPVNNALWTVGGGRGAIRSENR